jgi:hypothetical protein
LNNDLGGTSYSRTQITRGPLVVGADGGTIVRPRCHHHLHELL